MHETVIISVGYSVVRQAILDLLEFVIIAVSSFAVLSDLYELLIRRIDTLDFLLGMSLRPRT